MTGVGTRRIPAIREGMPEGRREPAAGPGASTLDEAVARAQRLIMDLQDPDGFWWGELESNPTMEAEYLFLTHILGISDETRWLKIRRHLLRKQQPDGGWSLYCGAAGDLSTSVECYLALKMAGQDANSSPMQRARKLILDKGGVEKTRVFTKIWLAMLGQWDWKGTPYLAPELMLLPNRLPLNIYELASWTRATVVPMTIILSQRPVWRVPDEAAINELYANGRERASYSLPVPAGLGWEWMLHRVDRLLPIAERFLPNPLRSRALRAAERWIVSHQEADGSWGGIQPPWVYSLIALHHLGYSLHHDVMRKGVEGFESFAIEDAETWRLQACVSPLWDTCLVMNALLESGVDPDDPPLVRAADWLIARQILVGGDWQVKNPDAPPGGWAFEFENDLYPDTDDAAEILLAIGRAGASDREQRDAAVERGLAWTISMQSGNGGWGAFDKDNTSVLASKLPFFDFGETIDPPSVDVTAHILEAIGVLGRSVHTREVRKALDYIWREQESDGPWFGRWGVNYLYGTGAVLPALAAVGHDMTDPRVGKAVGWVESCQNEDGGWGESCASYADPALRGRGKSTPSQTAWALLALIAAGRAVTPATARGAEYLVRTQEPDGSWEEPEYTATGFPGYGEGTRRFRTVEGHPEQLLPSELPSGFMIKYHSYRLCWPLLALGRYRAAESGGKQL